jgi:hypothetical protein
MREGGGPSPARDGSAASHLEGLTLFMYADHLLPLVGEMLPQRGVKDNKPGGGDFGQTEGIEAAGRARATVRNHVSDLEEDEVPERAARGLLTGWVAANTLPWLFRALSWAVFVLIAALCAALAWWRARRAVLKGALDDQQESELGPLPSEVVRERGLLAWIKGAG